LSRSIKELLVSIESETLQTVADKKGRQPVLSRKAFTTLGATSSNNTLATLGRHACAETVTAFTNQTARLEGTFHRFNAAKNAALLKSLLQRR
jgi:hypothetical protein